MEKAVLMIQSAHPWKIGTTLLFCRHLQPFWEIESVSAVANLVRFYESLNFCLLEEITQILFKARCMFFILKNKCFTVFSE